MGWKSAADPKVSSFNTQHAVHCRSPVKSGNISDMISVGAYANFLNKACQPHIGGSAFAGLPWSTLRNKKQGFLIYLRMLSETTGKKK